MASPLRCNHQKSRKGFSLEVDAVAKSRAGFGPTPRPVARGSLFARSGHPAL